MRFTKSAVAGTVEILAADDFIGIPVHLTGSGIIKAGMPITAAGAAVAAGTGAVGILLYDVDADTNPNGTVVTAGVIDWTKAMEHSGATATADAMADILPAITFRTNIGVNE